MTEFFREAPLAAIVLVVIGSVLAFVLSTVLEIRAAREKAAREQAERSAGLRALIRLDDGARTARVVSFAGYALIAVGLAIWIFDL